MNPNLIFVAAALSLWGIGEGMFFNFAPIYLKNQFLLNEQTIGFILGVFGLFMAVTHIPAGYLADRIGRRPMMIAAWLIGLVTTLIMGASANLTFYLIGFFSYGLTAFVSSSLSSYVTAARGKWPVSTALSWTTATFNMGAVLGPVTGGWLGERYGMRAAYWAAAGIFVISNIFIVLTKKQPIDHHDPEAPPPDLLANRRFIGFLFVAAFATFAMYIAQPLTPNFLSSERRLSLSQAGLIFTVGALGNSLIALMFSRVRPRRGFLFTQGLVALFALFIWHGHTLPVFMLGYFLLGGFRAARPMALAQARELVHASQMGLMYGTMETVSAGIFILTPILAGFLYERGPALVYPLAICLITASIIVSYYFSPQKERHA